MMGHDPLQEEISDRLKAAIHKCFSQSEEIQQILEMLHNHGRELKVWMLLGIILTSKTDEFQQVNDEIFALSDEDKTWLQSLKITIQETTNH